MESLEPVLALILQARTLLNLGLVLWLGGVVLAASGAPQIRSGRLLAGAGSLLLLLGLLRFGSQRGLSDASLQFYLAILWATPLLAVAVQSFGVGGARIYSGATVQKSEGPDASGERRGAREPSFGVRWFAAAGLLGLLGLAAWHLVVRPDTMGFGLFSLSGALFFWLALAPLALTLAGARKTGQTLAIEGALGLAPALWLQLAAAGSPGPGYLALLAALRLVGLYYLWLALIRTTSPAATLLLVAPPLAGCILFQYWSGSPGWLILFLLAGSAAAGIVSLRSKARPERGRFD